MKKIAIFLVLLFILSVKLYGQTAWNVTTAVYLQEFSVFAKEFDPTGLFFKPDGTKMYTIGYTGDTVDEYDLSGIDSVFFANFDSLWSNPISATIHWDAISGNFDSVKIYKSDSTFLGMTTDTLFHIPLSPFEIIEVYGVGYVDDIITDYSDTITVMSMQTTEYFSWADTLDRYGKKPGYFETTPFPITESTTEYVIMNDEYPNGKTFYLGTKYYVDGGYSGGDNDGSFEKPWTTITTALANIGVGNNTIIVRGVHNAFDGRYDEKNLVLKSGVDDTHRFMVVGYGQERPIVCGEDSTKDTFTQSFSTIQSYITVQRFKIMENYRDGVHLAPNDNYVNIIDLWLNNNCKWDSTKGLNGKVHGNGNVYFEGCNNIWIFHSTSDRTSGHGFKVSDNTDNAIVEWCRIMETGWWEGCTITSRTTGRQPCALDFPANIGESNDNNIVRYNIIGTACFQGIQLRRGYNFIVHHNEIYDAIHYGDVDVGSLGYGGRQIIIHSTNTFGKFYSNIVRDPGPNQAGKGTTGIFVNGCSGTIKDIHIFNNLFYGHDGASILVGTNNGGIVYVYNNTIFGNNPVYGNRNYDSAVNTQDTCVFKNNIVVQSDSGYCIDPSYGVPQGTLHEYNLYYAPKSSISISAEFTLGATEIEANPMFTDTTNRDFTLLFNSPAIDAGTNVGLTTDIMGNIVPYGIDVDMGAYEYQGISNIIMTRSRGTIGYFGRGFRYIDLRMGTYGNAIGIRKY